MKAPIRANEPGRGAALHPDQDDVDQRVRERTAELEQAIAALERELGERRRAETALREIVEGVEADVGEQFFPSLVRSLARSLAVQYAFVSEITEDRSRVRTLAVWGPNGFLPNVEFALAGTPCEAVLNGEMAHYATELQARFPADAALADWHAESYCGVPILDSSNRVVGHLAIVDDQPMPEGARALSIMRIFAVRAAAEFDRLRADLCLRESEQRLSRVLASAMDAIVTMDDDGRVVLFNAAAENVFRAAAEQVVGQPFDRFLTEAFRRTLDRSREALRRGDPAQPYVWAPEGLTARDGDGREFPIEGTISQAEVGGRQLYTLILRDIDARRRAEGVLRQLNLEREYLQEEIKALHNFDEIVGQSRALARVSDQIRLVADTDSSVLILGETGSGKELVARAIHSASRRCDRPLIKVNCAALPMGLIESELFGHERGAFTGASTRRNGRFELAHGGSIFLDEIGEVPAEVQVKLLRVLQEHEFERVGGHDTIKVDVRVIAATNRDLARAVAEGTFRSDLYYRLNVFPIAVPSLRERVEDIPLLAHYFLDRYAAKIGRKFNGILPNAVRRLCAYHWPGNVRELENVIERAVILSRGPDLDVVPELLPGDHVSTVGQLGAAPSDGNRVAVPPPNAAVVGPDESGALGDVERTHIVSVLRRTGWRIEGPHGAARLLKLNPSTLRSRMRKLGVRRSTDPQS